MVDVWRWDGTVVATDTIEPNLEENAFGNGGSYGEYPHCNVVDGEPRRAVDMAGIFSV